MDEAVFDGGCLCGDVRISARGAPDWTANCHCGDCRRATGAAMSAYAGYQADRIEITGRTYTEHESSPGVFRGFCSACGSRLTYRSARWNGEIHIHVGAWDTPDAFAPKANVYTKEKLEWLVLEPDLPALKTVSSDEV